jgi:hypothetical protein
VRPNLRLVAEAAGAELLRRSSLNFSNSWSSPSIGKSDGVAIHPQEGEDSNEEERKDDTDDDADGRVQGRGGVPLPERGLDEEAAEEVAGGGTQLLRKCEYAKGSIAVRVSKAPLRR